MEKLYENVLVEKAKILSDFSLEMKELFDEKVGSGLWIRLEGLTESEECEKDEHVKKMVEVKSKESHHAKDNQALEQRFEAGTSGEWVVKKYLGLQKPDLSIGKSFEYNFPDISDYFRQKIGVKTSQLGKAVMIHKDPKCHEIILVGSNGIWYLAGIASISVMRKHQSDFLFKTAVNNSKTCLTISGYKRLVPFAEFKYYLENKDTEWNGTGHALKDVVALYEKISDEDGIGKLRKMSYIRRHFPEI